MTKYPVLYWVEYWNDMESKVDKVSGCTIAKSFVDAMKKIESYYGDELCSVKIELLEEAEVLEFPNYEEAEKIAEIWG